ncbi:MAG: ADP-ribosylglycohydrolase family protein [Oscillospiraceae bacterium]|nr:ADP-ribosylglycohydrolase family protein [Oscillospiraceae bacterium]
MRNLDKFRGCLIGGAAGDALGYEVEFMDIKSIQKKYGASGIRSYELHNGVALISDDTQMTLFTATGLLLGTTRGMTRGVMGSYASCIRLAYQDWLKTQKGQYPEKGEYRCSWLSYIRDLYSRRAPGMTCMSAIENGCDGTVEKPINNSKGCGGVMRVAPIGLYFVDKKWPAEEVARIGAEAAALTHGHQLGYLPAAVLAHMIYELAGNEELSVSKAVDHAISVVEQLYPEADQMQMLKDLILKACELAEQNLEDTKAIAQLGAGWVAEETLAIAIYCALKYENDFDRALIASVNHSGDSDSTGAVTGNILGAKLGLKGIPEKYISNLELCDLIMEVADDLHHDCQIPEYETDKASVWMKKYNEAGFPLHRSRNAFRP